MTITVLQGGEILDRGGRRTLDVAVDDGSGLVAEVGPSLVGDRVLDATSCSVVPGLVDLHTHLRQPGFEAAGTIETGSRAAALGGYTAVVATPDTVPCADTAATIAEILALAKAATCEIFPAAALTMGREGASLAPYAELVDLGVRLFTDADRAVQDPAVLRRALEYLGGVGEAAGVRVVAANRGHLASLAGDGVMHEGQWSARLGLPGQPALAEELMVTRDIALSRLTGTRVHIQQVSTASAVELIRAAKAESLPVSAEVSPHHLVLSDDAIAGFDPNFKTCPPLRSASDVAALGVAVADGTIDAIATDHMPHTFDVKEQPFDHAPFGVLGLETALSVLLTMTDLDLDVLLPALSWQPAAIAGIADRHGCPIDVGCPANLAVVDPGASWTVGVGSFGGFATNSPFLGRQLVGRVRHTIYQGEPVMIDHQMLDGQ